MKINIVAILIAILYNIGNILMWQHIKTMPDASSMIYLIIYPCYWIIAVVIIAIIALKNKLRWFQSSYKFSTILALLFCTPIPFFVLRAVEAPSYYGAMDRFEYKGNYTEKIEQWNYNGGGVYVIKYWRANKPNCESCDTSLFKRDSTWVYFKGKDTLKVEVYKIGKLVSEKDYK